MKNMVKLLVIIAFAAIVWFTFAACDNYTETHHTDTSVWVYSVQVSPSATSLERGETLYFVATVTGRNNPPQTVTWSVSRAWGGTFLQGTSISASGELTIGQNELAGGITVRATSTFNSSVWGSATVTVSGPTVTSVVVNPQTASVPTGATHAFTATVLGTNNPPQTVTWTVHQDFSWTPLHPGTGIAADGQLTVDNNQNPGTFRVRATSTLDNWIHGEAIVTVP